MRTQTKVFEVRDVATFIPVLATRIIVENEGDNQPQDEWLVARAGFGIEIPYTMLTNLCSYKTHWDPWSWGGRTMSCAHSHIDRNWDELETGAVVDVRYINSETEEPARSDRYYYDTLPGREL